MSDTESNQASIDASDASIPAKNGSREVEHAPPPLGSEESESEAGVAARTRLQLQRQNAAGADESSARNEASSSLHGVATLAVPRIGVMTRRWPHHRRSANQW